MAKLTAEQAAYLLDNCCGLFTARQVIKLIDIENKGNKK